MKNKFKISATSIDGSCIKKFTSSANIPYEERSDYIIPFTKLNTDEDNANWGVVILKTPPKISTSFDWIVLTDYFEDFSDDDVLLINAPKIIRRLYHRGSNSNSIFLTSRCNSRCLMCPQPPKENEEVDFQLVLKQIELLPDNIEEICITGGEPTLTGEKLTTVLKKLAEKNPSTHVHVLSNARLCEQNNFARSLANTGLTKLSFGIPLYSSTPEMHNYIVQNKQAFDETIKGIYNLANNGVGIEIRVVLQKQTIPGLKELAHFIYNKFPYASHVAFMGMEHMGYVKKNFEYLWVSPNDYQDQLFTAIRYLQIRGINCSIYNLPYCLTEKDLWPFLRNSISDYKVDFDESCNVCSMKSECCGLFHYQKNIMPIYPIIQA